MAMSVLNNPTAKMTLGELNKNITAVGKQLRKVSSGQRIFGAGDGASEYAISEKMRTQLRGLGQDIQNVRTGTSLLRVAEGGMQSIVDEIRNMKELALNAANDHNTDLDRAVLQKDFEQRVANIEDISATTNYNGKILLKGDYNESRELLSRIEIPVVTPVTDTHRVRRQTGTRETQVTVDSPSVTKIKNSDGTTAIRQNNDVSGLATGFSPLYGSCTKTGSMKSGGRIDCDYGFTGNGSWSWGRAYVSENFPTTTATPQNVIKTFNQSLDATTKYGSDAVDEAIDAATNGAYAGWGAVAAQFMSDLRTHTGTDFLENYCGILLGNDDTGAITGWDAGGSTQKTAESIVPENSSVSSWGLPVLGGTTAFNGLTVHWPTQGVNGALSAAEEAVLKGLNAEWTQNCLDLIEESFGLDFQETGTTAKEITVKFENSNDGTLAYVSSAYDNSGKTRELSLVVNMNYYEDLVLNDPNGSTTHPNAGYLDRTLAHEFTHAAMAANIDNFAKLPLYIKEGMAELVHGIDDERGSVISYFAGSNGISYLDNMFYGTAIVDSSNPSDEISKLKEQLPYAGGYMFLRYLAKQGAAAAGDIAEGSFSSNPTSAAQMAIDIDFSSFDTLTVPDDFHQQGFSILCSGCPQYINITFDKGKKASESTFTRTDSYKSDYVIGIKDVTDLDGLEKAIFEGVAATDLSKRQDRYTSQVDISTTIPDGNGGETTELVNVVVDGNHGVCIAKKPDGNGYMFLKDNSPGFGILDSGTVAATEAADTTDDLPPGEIDEDGNETIPLDGPMTITITEPVYEYFDETTTTYSVSYRVEEDYLYYQGRPLHIHTGTKSNQDLAIFINDMSPKALGVDTANLTTREKASESLEVLDNALQYALDEVTRIGAYQSRLEYTEQALVAAQENTTASESTIRDADMAKEMTEYTKSNVIAQASQSMLAQANQNLGSVLGLLQ